MGFANVIQFSGGRTSAYMTYRLLTEKPNQYVVLFQNTGKEMPETLDFVNECDKRWGLNIVWLEYRFGHNYEVVKYETASRDGRPFSELIAHKKHFLPNRVTRYCTDQMKIQTARRYLKENGIKEWDSYLGIRYDEPRRWSKMAAHPDYYTPIYPLVDWKVNKQDVIDFWSVQPFDLNLREPYGNCDLCFLKGKGKLATIAKERPDLFEWWERQETATSRFKNEISYRQIREMSQMSPGLFDGDPSFECFCNID